MRRRARIAQIVHDFSRKPLSECSILDLACLDGDFSVEMAMRGARVLGIEGRSSNIEKAKARGTLPNLTYVQDDVRNLSVQKHGRFDIVLCLGILYHLDAPDCFKFLEAISEVCIGFAVIDTHVNVRDEVSTEYRGRSYSGGFYTEFAREPTPEELESKNWASIGNLRSFWPTKPSLVNAIVDSGFNSVYDSQYPAWNDIPADRIALVALKGAREKVLSKSVDEAIYSERVDEVPKVPAVSSQKGLRGRLGRLLGR